MSRIAVVVGSTRPGRKARTVADWVLQVGRRHPAIAAGEAFLEVVDLADVALPLLDEPVPAAFGSYQQPHTQRWAATIASFDGFIFVTPEYNHSYPAALKNAIDFLFAEWADKPAGFVSYGLAGGVRAVEHLKSVLSEVKAVPISSQVALSAFEDFSYADPSDPTSPATVTARGHQTASLLEVVEDCLSMCRALVTVRAPLPG
jgi:NAD(P)H-dependent FMN reductase